MPYLKIETNASLASLECESALKSLSAKIARQLNKPEDYVMTRIEHSLSMSFAGTNEPCAYCSLLSLGLEDEKIPELSQSLTEAVAKFLPVKPDRIYIHFQSPQRRHFAHNGKPFG